MEEFLQQLAAPQSDDSVRDELSESLFAAVVSSKWRRSALDAQSSVDIQAKLAVAVSHSRPVEFSVPFGGYKSWHERGAPGINWAEVFWIAHLAKHGRRIAKAHSPGVFFSLSYAGGVMDIVSNLPDVWQSSYTYELELVLRHFTTVQVRFELVDIADKYGGRPGIREALTSRIEAFRTSWPLKEEEKAKKIVSARRNLLLAGKIDLTASSSSDLERHVYLSALACDALDSLEERRKFNKYSERIQLVFIRGPIPSLHISSCRTSSFHPWVGTGILERDAAGRLIERIRSLSDGADRSAVLKEVNTQFPFDAPGLRSILVCEDHR